MKSDQSLDMQRHCLMTRRTPTTAIATLACILCGMSIVGCGSDDIGIVTGKITVDGAPAGPGSIMFDPMPGQEKIGPSAIGDITEDGQYELMRPGRKAGAYVGEYRVMILSTPLGEAGDEMASEKRRPSLINKRYEDIKKSGLKATVVSGKNEHDFDLKP